MNDLPEQPILDTTDRTDLLIWWTGQEECEAIGDELASNLPNYIRSEFSSRWGRNGRGRLWVADELGDVGIPWDETKPASRLAGSRGGIVIWQSDAHHVFGLPGFLTDLRLNVVNALEPES